MSSSPSGRPGPFAILLALSLPVFVLALNANSIWDANEAFYVETPRQMVVTGDWLNPSFNDQPRFNKPVLSYWIVAGLYEAFGITVATERVGIALGALGLILATFLIGRALGSARTGVLAALFVATAPRVVMFARRIFIDVWITCFMALTLACFVLAERYPAHRRTWLVLMYVAIGLGVLTKGPVALALPAAVGLVWLVIERRPGELRRLMLVPGALIVAAIALPWWIAQIPEHGVRYILEFWVGENLGRYSESMVPGTRSAFFYLPVLFGDLFPWAPLLIVPILGAWRGRRASESPHEAATRRLLWIWIVLIVGLFSLSATKQDLYIFPVVPAVAVLVARALDRTDFGRTHIGLRVMLGLVAAASVGAAVAMVRLFGSGTYALDGAMLAAVVVGGAGIAALGLLGWRRPGAAVLALATGFVAFNYVFVLRLLPDAERFKPVPSIARTFLDGASAEARLGAFGIMLPSLVYYARQPVLEQPAIDAAADFLADARESWLMTGAPEWEDLRRRVPGACVAVRRQLYAFDHVTLTGLAAGEPPPDVLLITNRCVGGAGLRPGAAPGRAPAGRPSGSARP